MDSGGSNCPLTLSLQPVPAEYEKGIAMTPPTSPQPPPSEPPNSLSARGRRRGVENTWELPVQQPHHAPPPMTRADSQDTEVSARRLWAGGGATAVVAAGIGVVGVLLIRGLLGIPILSAKGQLVDQAMAVVPISAALAALVATALLHLLLLTTPRPTAFFGAICAIVVAILVLQVFLVGEPRSNRWRHRCCTWLSAWESVVCCLEWRVPRYVILRAVAAPRGDVRSPGVPTIHVLIRHLFARGFVASHV